MSATVAHLLMSGVQPALIAALASRESLVYSTAVVDAETGISKDPTNDGYGMMQVGISHTHTLTHTYTHKPVSQCTRSIRILLHNKGMSPVFELDTNS